MLSTSELIVQLSKQQYPTGRAFRIPLNSNFELLHIALSVSEAQGWEDAVSILDSLLPDTDRFTEEDAEDWERRLGIITSEGTDLADRKAAIIQKLQAPGINPAKAHYLYIQQQLQLAGFDVWVHENIFPTYPPPGYITFAPNSLYGNGNFVAFRHGMRNHGAGAHGSFYNNIIANSITQAGDLNFNIGANFRCTFFIGGETIGTYANVPSSREQEFRQLVLKLKPVQNIGYLFINFI